MDKFHAGYRVHIRSRKESIKERKLADLKAQQLDGVHMVCPRCGLNQLKTSIHTNALSRHADIYICDPCGSAEAMLDFIGKTVPVDE